MALTNTTGTKVILKDTATSTLTPLQVTNGTMTVPTVIADGTVTETKIGNLAVTDAKISAVSSGKISGTVSEAAHAANADTALGANGANFATMASIPLPNQDFKSGTAGWTTTGSWSQVPNGLWASDGLQSSGTGNFYIQQTLTSNQTRWDGNYNTWANAILATVICKCVGPGWPVYTPMVFMSLTVGSTTSTASGGSLYYAPGTISLGLIVNVPCTYGGTSYNTDITIKIQADGNDTPSGKYVIVYMPRLSAVNYTPRTQV